MPNFGFIITRHVNSVKTNEYWNHSVKLIRTNYPFKKIVIIDDNSNYDYVKSNFNYKNVEIIQSEYPGRGELLPFVYYLRHKWFENAVIIHDSLFFHKRIPFETFKIPVLPLWHAKYDNEYTPNLLRISSYLNNNVKIKHQLLNQSINILGITQNNNFDICFGGQCYINHNFLIKLEQKYNLSNLVNVVKCRIDRQGLERILGALFKNEFHNLINIKSLYGSIFSHYRAFGYNYDDYINDFNEKKIYGSVVKIWTGR